MLNATAASLLGFLGRGPMTGDEIVAKAERTVGHFWNLTRSQVYRELKLLARRGYLRRGKEGPRARQPFIETAAGHRAFDRWIARDPGPELMRSPLLLKVFFWERIPPRRLREIVALERAAHTRRLALYREIHARVPRQPTARFAVMYEETFLAWLKTLGGAASRSPRRAGRGPPRR